MDRDIKLTIIIPVYNLEDYIMRCLDSIVNQIEEKVEVIIINDGSTDKTAEICNKYAKKYKYIKYFYQKNAGVSSARNSGIEQACGEYIWFVDGDDWILEKSIKRILKEIEENNDIEIFLGDFIKNYNKKTNKKCNVKKEKLKRHNNCIKYPQNYINLFKYNLCNLSLWCNIIKKDIFSLNNIKFDVSVKHTEDLDCMLELLLSVSKVKLLINPIYVYRQGRENSATTNYTAKRVNDIMNFVIKWYDKINNNVKNDELKEYLLDFVRYQYFIALGTLTIIPEEKQKKFINELSKYKFLFETAHGPKQKIVKKTYDFFGFNITCKLMGIWIKIK